MSRKLQISIKEWLGVILLFACNGLSWWYFRSYLNFLIGVWMILGILLSAVLLWHGKDKLQIEISLPGDVVGKETSVPFLLGIVNGGWLPYPVSIRYELDNAFTDGKKEYHYLGTACPGRGIFSRKNKDKKLSGVDDMLAVRHYGNLTVRVLEVRVYDFLHLFYWRGCPKREARMMVAPGNTKSSVQAQKQIAYLMPRESLRKSADYSADYEIREYRPRDNMKNIHWKLTAKQGKLMVKERLSDGKPTVNVVLTLTDSPGENDVRMEVLDGLCRQLLTEKYPIKLYWSRESFCLQLADISSAEELELGVYDILSSRGCRQTANAMTLFEEEHPGEEAIHVGTMEILEKTE